MMLSRVDKLEAKVESLEMYNQNFMQRNYELSKELQKTKDYQKMIEKVMMMYVSNMDPASKGNFLNVMSSISRKPQLEAPPIIVEPDRIDGTVDT